MLVATWQFVEYAARQHPLDDGPQVVVKRFDCAAVLSPIHKQLCGLVRGPDEMTAANTVAEAGICQFPPEIDAGMQSPKSMVRTLPLSSTRTTVARRSTSRSAPESSHSSRIPSGSCTYLADLAHSELPDQIVNTVAVDLPLRRMSLPKSGSRCVEDRVANRSL